MSQHSAPVAAQPRRRAYRSPATIALAAAAIVATAVAHGATSARAETPRELSCSFPTGQIASFEDGKFRREPTAMLTFEIADVDLERQVAALVTTGGRGELRVVRAINANHFLEVVTEGFLNITTIYDVGGTVFPAVHSRHLGLLGQPVVAQYQGECRAKA